MNGKISILIIILLKNFEHSLIKYLPNYENTTSVSQDVYESTLRWLCTPPRISSYKVNQLKNNTNDILELIQKYFEKQTNSMYGSKENIYPIPNIFIHPELSNVIIVENLSVLEKHTERFDKEIIVDVECASAVLRGAHIYAPGVLGMSSGTHIGDKVSIYADIGGKCKRGLQKIYENSSKVFIGNGIAKMQRYQLFGENSKLCGLGIIVTETISGCPSLSEDIFPPGTVILQNLPSLLCVLGLDPKPGETVIDMCASPGNKTIHIAELMENKGTLIAIDKTPQKVEILKKKCESFGVTNAILFQADSTKILKTSAVGFVDNIMHGPPFLQESFDKILLDAPCSVLGKRPQFANRMSANEIKSFVPLQRKLMETAVQLLKPNGTLVYSTCTITLAENEGMVAWVLGKFKNISLLKPKLCLGEHGWPGTSLTSMERQKVQRFGPHSEVDSVGFFFCVFTKNIA